MTSPKRLPARQALIEAAFDILSTDTGASLADIAAAAGVGRATLHRHFASRDDLLRTLTHVAIEEMDAATNAACDGVETYAEALRLCLEALIPLGNRHGFLAREPFSEGSELAAEFARMSTQTAEMVDAARREGLFAPTIPTSWIVQAYDHLLYAAWESVRTGDATAAQAAGFAWRTLTKGLGPDTNDL